MDETIKKKKSLTALIIAVIAIIAIAVIAAIVVKTGSPEYKLKKQLEIADKYLAELNYEQAIVTYSMALDIDPKSEEAYLGMAEAYVGMGNLQAAIDTLTKGAEHTGSEAIKERLAELEKQYKDQQEKEQEAMLPTPTPVSEKKGATNWRGGDWTDRDDVMPHMNDEGYMVFGAYEQDGDENDGPEPIEWEVLESNGNGIFLVSRYVLDAHSYNDDDTDVTWENCTMRAWLNGEFLNKTFTTAERERIKTTNVVNPDNKAYGTEGGNDTQDKVFLLSADDVISRYSFNSWYDEYQYGYSMELIIPVTGYAKKQGIYTHEITDDDYYGYEYDWGSWHGLVAENYSLDCVGRLCTWWWLRSPGAVSDHACVEGFGYDGCTGWNYGYRVNSVDGGVRPALYISK